MFETFSEGAARENANTHNICSGLNAVYPAS